MLEEPQHGVTILPVEACDPVAWWNVPGIFLEAREPPSSPFVHMYQSIWAAAASTPSFPSRRTRWPAGCGGGSGSESH